MDPQISLFNNFFIKYELHGTIHTFKNYFATVFFNFQFQFSIFSCIQTDPYLWIYFPLSLLSPFPFSFSQKLYHSNSFYPSSLHSLNQLHLLLFIVNDKELWAYLEASSALVMKVEVTMLWRWCFLILVAAGAELRGVKGGQLPPDPSKKYP